MEYLMTYGWAILVVVIVGVVLWQMGVFSGGGSSASTFTGFGPLKPVEWSCNADTDVLTVTITNGAGGMVTNLTITSDGTSGTCTPTEVSAGGTTVCTVSTVSPSQCATVAPGSTYVASAEIGYISPTGQTRSSSGTVRGPAD